ncbi:MAG TPA: T9SS type A sorting domain-containing protein [Bacteroidales bacterium]|nr:T9SS type A sorting domain-containing protein [Bacteroidales bacterium]
MKKLYLVLFAFLSFLCNPVSAQTPENWSVNYVPRYRCINDIHFWSPFQVSIVGGNPSNDSILYWTYSSNGGAEWDYFGDHPMNPMLNSAVFINEHIGYAGGMNEVLYKTENSGKLWFPVALNISLNHADINKLCYSDVSGIWAAGGLDGNSAFVLNSSDLGNSWNVAGEWGNNELISMAVSPDQTVYICGTNNFLKYNDETKTNWADVNISSLNGTVDFTSLFFYGNIGFCTGGTRGSDSTRVVLKTIDGGVTWLCILEEAGPRLNCISVIDENNLVAAGDYGTILKSSNGGETWQSIDFSEITYLDFYSVCFTNTHLGAVGGNFGHFIKYYDGSPLVATNNATNVGKYKATLNAQVQSVNESCTAFFCYGTDENTEHLINMGEIQGSGISNITYDLSELSINTKYFFRVKLTDGNSQNYFGELKSFYTGNPIPNWDFEIWDNTLPTGWFYEYSYLPVEEMPPLPFSKNTIGHLSPTGINIQEVISEGRNENIEGEIYTDLFPVSVRHTTLEGYYTYYSDTQDTAKVSVMLFHGDDTVGTGSFNIFLQYDYYVYDWTKFIVPIHYTDENTTPDFAKITIRSTSKNNPAASTLGIDKLGFDGDFIPVLQVSCYSICSLYPNPCSNFVRIKAPVEYHHFTARIYNFSGKLLQEKSFDGNLGEMFTGELSSGLYVIEIKSETVTQYSKLIVK